MSSTTVSNLISDIRYDLKDLSKQKYDNTYLVKILNRGIHILERELISINSDLNTLSTSGTLTSGNNYIELDKTVDHIKYVYISQDEIFKKPLRWLYKYRINTIGSATNKPYYFAVWGRPTSSNGRKLEFDYTADQDYTVNYIYSYRTGDLSLTDYVPYDDMFNDYLREGVVVNCKKIEDEKIVNSDMLWREMFRQHVNQLDVIVSHIPTYYKLDF